MNRSSNSPKNLPKPQKVARLPRIERGTCGLEVLDAGFVGIRKDRQR